MKNIILAAFAITLLTSTAFADGQRDFYATSNSTVTMLSIPDVQVGDAFECIPSVQVTTTKLPLWLFGGFGLLVTSSVDATFNGLLSQVVNEGKDLAALPESREGVTVGNMFPCGDLLNTVRMANACTKTYIIEVSSVNSYPAHLDIWSDLNGKRLGAITDIGNTIYCRRLSHER